MQVIRIEDLPLQKPSSTARGGLEYYRILEGKPGDPGNFMLLLSATLPGYYSPRHKHNFEQIRFKVDQICRPITTISATPVRAAWAIFRKARRMVHPRRRNEARD